MWREWERQKGQEKPAAGRESVSEEGEQERGLETLGP